MKKDRNMQMECKQNEKCYGDEGAGCGGGVRATNDKKIEELEIPKRNDICTKFTNSLLKVQKTLQT